MGGIPLLIAAGAPAVGQLPVFGCLPPGLGDRDRSACAALDLSVSAWVADDLLAIFFFVVGLELKRSSFAGDLRDPPARRLPIPGRGRRRGRSRGGLRRGQPGGRFPGHVGRMGGS